MVIDELAACTLLDLISVFVDVSGRFMSPKSFVLTHPVNIYTLLLATLKLSSFPSFRANTPQ
jgi:hypothetical protein